MTEQKVKDNVQWLINSLPQFREQFTSSSEKIAAYYLNCLHIQYIDQLFKIKGHEPESILRWFRKLEPEAVKHIQKEQEYKEQFSPKLVLTNFQGSVS